jgi:hypothetical protein
MPTKMMLVDIAIQGNIPLADSIIEKAADSTGLFVSLYIFFSDYVQSSARCNAQIKKMALGD